MLVRLPPQISSPHLTTFWSLPYATETWLRHAAANARLPTELLGFTQTGCLNCRCVTLGTVSWQATRPALARNSGLILWALPLARRSALGVRRATALEVLGPAPRSDSSELGLGNSPGSHSEG